jgi:DNA polymerase-1
VIYGFLKFVKYFHYKTCDDNYVFCFDSKTSKRKTIYPEYKGNRKKDKSEEERKARHEFIEQIKNLRRQYLKSMGFKNVFVQKGYEADDIIASICKHKSRGDKFMIVSADEDLYQLLDRDTEIYLPQQNTFVTIHSFERKYHIQPRDWPEVKAIAGCSSDNIKGVNGVGETRAIEIVRDTMNKKTQSYRNYEISVDNGVIKRNLKLVKLPLKGTRKFQLRYNDFSEREYRKVVKSLGMKSLY